MEQVVKQKKVPLRLQKLSYDKNSQDVELVTCMPIIARVNAKSLDIFNNELFSIVRITKDCIHIQDDQD